MLILFIIIIFIFGLVIGSFLNVIICRLNTNKNIIISRSECPHCQHKLGFFDLIPLLSFILLKGKCRYCHAKISWQYPLIELATGVCFLLLYCFKLSSESYQLSANSYQLIANSLFYLFSACVLLIIFTYDLKHYLIPNKIVYPAFIIILILQIISLNFNLKSSSPAFMAGVIFYLIGALIPGLFFLILVLVSKEKWMGAGDVKLGFLCGLMLGYPNILVALFISFVFGAIIGIALILFHKKKFQDKLPYGTFLTVSTFIALLFSSQIIDWYLKLLGI